MVTKEVQLGRKIGVAGYLTCTILLTALFAGSNSSTELHTAIGSAVILATPFGFLTWALSMVVIRTLRPAPDDAGPGHRARARNARQEAEIDAVGAAIFKLLSDDVHLVLGFLLEETETTESDANRYKHNALAFRNGAEAVLLANADAYGAEFHDSDRAMKCGAMIAHAARNAALFSGSYDPAYREDVIRAIQFPR